MKKKNIIPILVIAFIFMITPFIIYFVNFNGEISGDDQNWANFSTFVGGITSSLFSFMSFLMIYFTLIQNRELNKEDEIENRFFKYIDLIKISINNCSVDFEMGETILKKHGDELLHYFCSLYFQVLLSDDLYNISIKKIRTESEQKILTNFFVIYNLSVTSIQPHINLIKIVIDYITQNGKEKENEYLKILDTQLSKNEKAIFSLQYREILQGKKYQNIFMVNNEYVINDYLINRIKKIIENYKIRDK